jgi:hypothetical protein
MKHKIAYSAIVAVILLAPVQLAKAQGPAGGTGAVASIPSSIVRAERGQVTQPGIFGMVIGAPPPNPYVDPKPTTAGPGRTTPPAK